MDITVSLEAVRLLEPHDYPENSRAVTRLQQVSKRDCCEQMTTQMTAETLYATMHQMRYEHCNASAHTICLLQKLATFHTLRRQLEQFPCGHHILQQHLRMSGLFDCH